MRGGESGGLSKSMHATHVVQVGFWFAGRLSVDSEGRAEWEEHAYYAWQSLPLRLSGSTKG